MTRDLAENLEMCPFWSMGAMKCQLYGEGLFIPFNDHIEVYCTTLQYPQCLQFSLHASRARPIEKNRPNRRKYERLAASHKVTLVRMRQLPKIAANVSTAHILAATANTLDLSRGGMRLETEQPLRENTLIRFSFGESFPKSVQTGEGQIAWCNKQKNECIYQAGIAFQGDRHIETIGLYLGLLASLPPSAG